MINSGRAIHLWIGQIGLGQAKSPQATSDQVSACPFRSGQNKSVKVGLVVYSRSTRVSSGSVRSSQIRADEINSGQVFPDIFFLFNET